jgi:RNA polymerase sigma factor (sigma-70 family)
MKPTGDVTRQIHAEMKAGDRTAFDRFFERHAARVLVYIHYNLGPRLRQKLEPEDILQNVYLRLFQNFDSFSARAEERGIQKTLIRMAEHEITEAYRYHFKVDKRSAKREILASYLQERGSEDGSPMDWVAAPATSITQRVIRQEEYQRLMEVLGGFTPIEQYVTVARVIEGLSSEEIAAHTGKSRGAVRMMISRVRDKLRKAAE